MPRTRPDAASAAATVGNAGASEVEDAPASLRVVALIDTAALSGPGRQLTALAQDVRRLGVEIVVILFRRAGRPSSPLVGHLSQARVRYIELPERGPLDIGLVSRVASVLRDLSPDVVQTHSYRTTAIMSVLRALGHGTPWVAFQHGATAQDRKVRFYHWLDRRLAGRADRVVVMSQRHRERWGQGAKVQVIYNAAIPLTTPKATPASSVGNAERPVFGVVGRLSFEKGVDVFLEACALLKGRRQRFSALVVGDGPERGRLESLRGLLHLNELVAFRPSTTDVRSIYAGLDALVIPSRSEGLPNVLLEALSEDLPVVSTAVGAVPEVLTDADSGIVVPPDDPAALAEAMARIADVGRTTSAREARRACIARFSLEARGRAHVEMYRELTGQRKVARRR